MVGEGLWEETLHDMVVENVKDCWDETGQKVFMWKVYKRVPEPENSQQGLEEVKRNWVKCLKLIQSIAEQQGKRFIINDEVLGVNHWWEKSVTIWSLCFSLIKTNDENE